MFEQFVSRVTIEAKLIAITPLFVGARVDSFKPGTINGSCVKDVYGRPYIPGSSLKGVLRAFAAIVSGDERDLPDRSEANSKKYSTKPNRVKAVADAKATNKSEYEGMADEQILADLIYKDSTRVEALFGSTVMASKVKIADAIPVETHVITEVRNGVAIDRDTHTAVGGALYDTEAVPSGTAFRFSATAENLSPDEADLFGKLLEYFAAGNITVGGRSRAGLGTVRLDEIKTKIIRKTEKEGFPQEELIEDGLKGIKEAVEKCSQS